MWETLSVTWSRIRVPLCPLVVVDTAWMVHLVHICRQSSAMHSAACLCQLAGNYESEFEMHKILNINLNLNLSQRLGPIISHALCCLCMQAGSWFRDAHNLEHEPEPFTAAGDKHKQSQWQTWFWTLFWPCSCGHTPLAVQNSPVCKSANTSSRTVIQTCSTNAMQCWRNFSRPACPWYSALMATQSMSASTCAVKDFKIDVKIERKIQGIWNVDDITKITLQSAYPLNVSVRVAGFEPATTFCCDCTC